MEAAQDRFWDRLTRVRALVLLVFQIAVPIAGIVYLFVRGADVYIVSLMLGTMYSLRRMPVDREAISAAVLTRLAGGKLAEDRKAS